MRFIQRFDRTESPKVLCKISQHKAVELSIIYLFISSWWSIGTTVDCHVCWDVMKTRCLSHENMMFEVTSSTNLETESRYQGI